MDLVYEGFLSFYNKSVNVTFGNNAVSLGVILFRDKKLPSPCIIYLIKVDALSSMNHTFLINCIV